MLTWYATGQMNALGLLNAQLELRFELIRAITPKYSQYKYIKSPTFSTNPPESSPLTRALNQHSKTAKKWTTVDVDAAALTARCAREEAIRKLQQWHDSGAIELHPSSVIHRFRVLKPVPQTAEEKTSIIQSLHDQIKARERSDMQRVHAVINLITAHECIARKLALHFGDEASVPVGGCGHCNFCLTREAVSYHADGDAKVKKEPIDEIKIAAVLNATGVRDDALFLARVAFGISSPRVTGERLGRSEVFGSMSRCDFEVRESFLICAVRAGGLDEDIQWLMLNCRL